MAMHRNEGRNRLYNAQKPRQKHSWACWLLVAVIFAGSFCQIWSLACLMGQNKQIKVANVQLQKLREDASNAHDVLLQYTSLKEITARAEKLGMVPPETDDIRRVPVMLAADNSDTNAQTANSGGNQ